MKVLRFTITLILMLLCASIGYQLNTDNDDTWKDLAMDCADQLQMAVGEISKQKETIKANEQAMHDLLTDMAIGAD